MKISTFVTAIVALALVATLPVSAKVITFEFDPNVLMDNYPATWEAGSERTTQEDARLVYETRIANPFVSFTGYSGTFDVATHGPDNTETGYNSYVNWRQSLGAGEGIMAFNNYFAPSTSVSSWGQNIFFKSTHGWYGEAADGWKCYVVDAGSAGKYVVWYTLDPSLSLRPGGSDLGTFRFTADVYIDSNGNFQYDEGEDDSLDVGQTYRLWFGAGNSGGSMVVFDNAGWGTLTPAHTPFSATSTSAFMGVVDCNTTTTKTLYSANNRSACDLVTGVVSPDTRFKIWGSVVSVDGNAFTIDDGSGTPIVVDAPWSGVSVGDFVTVTGTLDHSTTPVVMTSSFDQVEIQN